MDINKEIGLPVLYRSYVRTTENGQKESWNDVCDRTIKGLAKVGRFTDTEHELVDEMQRKLKCLSSGRFLWVGGTPWSENPENYPGVYNCTSLDVTSWDSFAKLMDLAMQGCGTGAVLLPEYLEMLPTIRNSLNVFVGKGLGTVPRGDRLEETTVKLHPDGTVNLWVGDSRSGWVESYLKILELSSDPQFTDEEITVIVHLDNVRPAGEPLRGFGGVSNPVKLPDMYPKLAKVLNGAKGRKLNSLECCLLIDEAMVVVVAGNVRRSAGMKQGASSDSIFSAAKQNLWQQDENGEWRIDPERDALRMSNHTRVYFTPPTEDEVIDAVRKQFYTGEGAIMWAGESIYRANIDLFPTQELKKELFKYLKEENCEGLPEFLKIIALYQNIDLSDEELDYRAGVVGLNPCVAADTWIHTEFGPRQVKELIGVQHGTFVNGELFSTTPEGFFETGTKPVFKLETKEGFSVRLTEDHQVLKVTSQTQKKQYVEWVAAKSLMPGDKVRLHNHREIQRWEGQGTFDEGWLLGNMVCDGSIAKNSDGSNTGLLRYWGESQDEMLEYAVATLNKSVSCAPYMKGYHNDIHNLNQVSSSGLAKLAENFGITRERKTVTSEVERGSYDFCCGFLRGLFDADGSVQGEQNKGVSVRLPQSNLESLFIVQRMLARLGIISTIYQNRRPDCLRMMPYSNRKPALYHCKATHELVISKNNLPVFQKLIGFREPAKNEKLDTVLKGYKRTLNRDRFTATVKSITPDGIEPVYDCTVPGPSRFDGNGLVLHNCAEILLRNNFCNLSEVHLNNIDPLDFAEQKRAFTAGAYSVAALLNHKFADRLYQESRELDPIVGVSFTGLFDFFVNAFGADWLRWWQAGRPEEWTPVDNLKLWAATNCFPEEQRGNVYKRIEAFYLQQWRWYVHEAVWDYCDRHNLKRPNRCTTVQPAGTKSLLTNASPGWHPPKYATYIRRVGFNKNHPVARACMDYGFRVIPDQESKHPDGTLLAEDDIWSDRCLGWLVEIPMQVSWANLPGIDEIDISKFSALAQFDFWLQVQQNYTTHNCFARNTEFLTDQGVKTFEDFSAGDSVNVLNADGDWVPATVVNTGEKREMVCITLQEGRTGKLKTITSTLCHRFPVRRASGGLSKIKTLTADKLKPGHRMVLNAPDLPDIDDDGIRHGIVFGDGSLYRNKQKEYVGSQLYLCGAKRHLQSHFASFSRTIERDDIDQTRIYGLPVEWKSLPDDFVSQKYIAGFLAGLLATDGNISSSTISISTGLQEVVDFIVRQSPRLGIKVTGWKWFESNSYKEKSGAFQVLFSKATFPENLILRPHHLEHFRSRKSQPCQWRVVSIFPVESEVGWCVMEPKTEHFTLSENILVMNTSATIEFTEDEIEPLGKRIYQAIENDEGYVSVALLARFNSPYPRLPFQPVSKYVYQELVGGVQKRRKSDNFHRLVEHYYQQSNSLDSVSGPAPCDSDKCLI